jgi:hypothetical protein
MVATVLGRCVRAAVSVAVVVSGILVVLAGPSSATTARPHQGDGYAVAGGDFVGFYATSTGAKVYCLSPRKALPSSITLRTAARYRSVTKTASQQLAYALTRWGNAQSAHAAAAESQLVNTIAGNRSDVARRARQLPKSVASVVRRHLELTRRFYGPYVTTVGTPKAVLPGQSGTGSVVITSAAGHRVTGTTVQLSGSANASVPRRITTGATGVGRFTYRATDVGEVHITATALDLPATTLRVNHPGAGQQHMVTWSPEVTSRGSASFQRTPSGFANTYACTSTCDGKPETTVTACAPASSYASRIGYHYAGQTAYVRFPAGTRRACKHLSLSTKDGDHVWARWQYKTRHGWSKVQPAQGSFTVDCPAVPAVGVTMSYDCTKASVTVGLAKSGAGGTWSPLVNSSRHRMVLIINGQQRIYADHGHSAVFTASAACGSKTTYTVQAGVQRAAGQYNYGLVASVTTP